MVGNRNSLPDDEFSEQDDHRNNFSEVPAPRKRRRFILLPLLIALGVIAFQYLSAETYINPETGQSVRVAISPEQEATLGLQSFQEVLSQSEVIQNGPEVDISRRVAKRLIDVVDPESKNFSWEVQVIRSDQMNAFCLPGGKIAVYTGILPITKDDDGLAAVMGHEIAHATSRHGAQRLLQQSLVQTGMMGLSGATAEMNQSERRVLLGVLGAGVQYGLILPYGRDHEVEADEIGLKYLIRAGYRPEAAIEFWERMDQAGGAQPPEWASTHPSHGTRIERLRKLVAEYQAAKVN
jgi:metalloendopeptidase OMA1, mitochondrial